MASPGPIITQVVIQGSSWVPTFELRKASGSVYDLSPVSVDVHLRLSKDFGGTVITFKKSTGDTAFPAGADGTNGQIIFICEQADTLAIEPGLYIMEIVFIDTNGSPPTKDLVGRGLLRVEAPRTGAI